MKVDLKKELEPYTAPRGRFELVTVPPLRYLALDGHGDPNTSAGYRDALQTLYPVAYAVKFLSKRTLDRDYTVMPLEALWWADDMESFTSARDKSQWHWTVLNLLPDWILDEHVAEARDTVTRKGGAPLLDEESGLRMTGRHHEVYLSDARRTAPEKLRTILRQPVERVGAGG